MYFEDEKMNLLAMELRSFAERQAEIEGVAFYKILRRKSIINICLRKPKTMEDLYNMKTLLGKEKANKYGEEILNIVNSHFSNDCSDDEKLTEEKTVSNSYTNIESYISVLQGLLNDTNIFTGEIIDGLDVEIKEKIIGMSKYFEKRIKSKMKKDQQFIRHHQKWTDEEDERLIKEFKEGKTIEELSLLHNRSKEAIRSRLLKVNIFKE